MKPWEKFALILLVLASLFLAAVVGMAADGIGAGQEPRTANDSLTLSKEHCGGHPHLHGIRAYDDLLARSWERSDPYDDEPRADWQIERLRHYRACARGDRVHRLMREHAAEARRAYRRWQERMEFRATVTPYYYGDYDAANSPNWVAIPPGVVYCESGTSGGWDAHNPSSGAHGLYQFLPSTYASVCEVCDWSKRDQHLAAQDVWARSGGSEWSCA
jgi:hypothetical protein